MLKKTTIATALAVGTAMLLVAGGCTATNAGKSANAGAVDYTKMSAEALAEHLIFESGSYDLEIATQEGKTGRDRMVQDELQKACSALRGNPVDPETAAKVNAMARETIKYPEGGIKLGDWKNGRVLAWSGFGYRLGHNPDNHEARKEGAGANCYNCHQLATDRTGGTIGPSLTGYGKTRGTSEAILKYAYEIIYNPHAYFACTHMPRMGANGVMTQAQIADVMAYLFDPESPVNK